MRKSINTEVSNHCTLALHISNIYKTLGLDLPAQCLWKRQSQPQHMIYHCIQYEQEMVLCHKDQPFNGQRPLKRPKSKKSFLVWAAGQRWQKLAGCGRFRACARGRRPAGRGRCSSTGRLPTSATAALIPQAQVCLPLYLFHHVIFSRDIWIEMNTNIAIRLYPHKLPMHMY